MNLNRVCMGSSGRQISSWVTNAVKVRGENVTINSMKQAHEKQFRGPNRPRSSPALSLGTTPLRTSVFPSAEWDPQTRSLSAATGGDKHRRASTCEGLCKSQLALLL